MSKRLKIGGGILVLVIILSAVFALFVLPGVFESKEKEVLQKLEKKGVTIKYAALEKSLQGTFSFRELSIVSDKKGMALDCQFKKVDIDVAIFASLSGTPKIDAVEIDGGNCSLDTKKKKGAKKKDKKKDSKASPFPDIEIPALKITDTIFRLKQNSLRINNFSSASEGPVLGNIILRALGEKYTMKVTGTVKDKNIQLGISPDSGESFDVNILGNKFKVGSIGADISFKKSQASAFVKELNIERKGVSIQAKKASAKFSPSTKPTFFIEGTKVQLDKNILTNFVAPKKVKTDSFDTAAPLVSPFAILDKLEVHFSDLSLWMKLADREIGLIEKAKGRWVRGELDVDGEVAKGKLKAHAIVSPTEKKVYRLDADIENVQLGAMPGMPAGRSSLPNRGTSGKLDGMISGSFRLQSPWNFAVDNALNYAMNVRWEDGVLDLEGVSQDPLDGIDISTMMHGKVNLATFEATNQGIVFSRGLPLSFRSTISGWPEDLNIDFALEGKKKTCEQYFSALPKAVWGPLKNATISGNAELKVGLKFAKSRPEETTIKITGYEKCIVDNLKSSQKIDAKISGKKTLDFSDVGWLEKPFIRKVREVDAGREVFVGPGTSGYVSIDGLPKHVGAAAYLSEQINFYTGRAINFALIQKALQRNLDEGRFVYGGSTITQQLVKNLFLTRDKTLARKLQEFLISWRMESVLSKDTILELYLNCIEFGPNLYGIGRAARHYFQKSATLLTPKESVFLAMLKPAPWRGVWYVNRGATPTNPYFLERTDILLDRLVEKEIITKELRESERRVGLTWNDGKYSRVLLPEVVDASLDLMLEGTPKVPTPTP